MTEGIHYTPLSRSSPDLGYQREQGTVSEKRGSLLRLSQEIDSTAIPQFRQRASTPPPPGLRHSSYSEIPPGLTRHQRTLSAPPGMERFAEEARALPRSRSYSELPPGLEPLLAKREENSLHSCDHRQIEERFYLGNGEIATATTERYDTVAHLKKGNKDRLEALKEQSAEEGAQFAIAQEKQGAIDRLKGDWFSSQSKGLVVKRVQREGGDRESRLRKEMPPLATNQRYVTVATGEGTIGFTRSGAYTDYTKGRTDLKEIKRAIALPPGEEKRALAAKILGHDEPLQDADIDPLLKRELDERRYLVETQVLQDLCQQVENRSGNLKEPFVLARLSLLDGVREPSKNSGLFTHERSQMHDMAELYEELDGAPIIFDGKGPFRDLEGTIHLPYPPPTGEDSPKTLRTLFFNVSPQMNTKNIGPQRELNEEAIEKARELFPEGDWESITERFAQGESSYSLAADIGDLLITQKAALGVSCFSGKDRTGVVSAMLTERHLSRSIDKTDLPAKEKEKLKAKIGRRLLSEEGAAIKVAEDNTGFRCIKVTVFDLQLLFGMSRRHTDKIKGIFNRSGQMVDAMGSFVKVGRGESSPGMVGKEGESAEVEQLNPREPAGKRRIISKLLTRRASARGE